MIRKTNNKKLIIYELNEVPRKLIEYYLKYKPNCNIKKIINQGFFIDTFTLDEGELHPWSTWPTVHRGVPNKFHNIKFINQDLKKSQTYKPIWEFLIEKKISVGIFGSLQSYPPIKNNNVKFFLPDTFAPNELAFPKKLMDFQKFNLDLVKNNKAISTSITKKQIVNFLTLFFNNTISKKSFIISTLQILKELLKPIYKKRRSMVQPVISFDLYLKYLKNTKPEFSTFFTNHVAGMMHRYWKYLFPNDNESRNSIHSKFHSKSILKAMDIADFQLGELSKFTKANNYDLWIISSMGQDYVDRGNYIPELLIKDFNSLLKVLNLNKDKYSLLPAMQPDICLSSNDLPSFNILRDRFKNITDSNGNLVFKERYKPVGLRLNLSIIRSSEISQKKVVFVKKRKFNIKDLGLEIIRRDVGTGYHIPKGVFIGDGNLTEKVYKKNIQNIDTCKIAPTILNHFNLSIPNYMQKNI
tara:strand:- start:26383 stop:27789 length:1407 start_codon:yes stop_codon:yes gene_type:complete